MKTFGFSLRALSICSPHAGCIPNWDMLDTLPENASQNDTLQQNWLPDTDFIPKRKFRRLSRLSKMALYTAHHASEYAKDLKIGAPIFCSHYGEIQHTFQVLKSIYEKDLVSPMDFSYSVHNTGQGLFSILHEDVRPATVLSSRHDALEQSLVKAYAQLHNGDEAVLIVYAEDELPAIFDSLNYRTSPLAFAFVVTRSEEGQKNLTLSHRPKDEFQENAGTLARFYTNQHEMNIQSMLLQGSGRCQSQGGRLLWNWEYNV